MYNLCIIDINKYYYQEAQKKEEEKKREELKRQNLLKLYEKQKESAARASNRRRSELSAERRPQDRNKVTIVTALYEKQKQGNYSYCTLWEAETR